MEKLQPDEMAERLVVVDVDDVTLWDSNPNEGDAGAIHASMEAFGDLLPILITTDQHGRSLVVDGNWRVRVERHARRFGGKLAAIDVTGLDEWSDIKALAAGLTLNSTARAGRNDPTLMAAALIAIRNEEAGLLEAMSVTEADIQALLEEAGAATGPTAPEGSVDPDELPDDAPAVTKAGDIWLLGPHRVMAGDAFDPASFDALLAGATIGCLLTDPPYGMGLDPYGLIGTGSPKSALAEVPKRKKYRAVIGDDTPFDAGPVAAMFADVDEQFWFGADYYRRTLPAPDDAGSWLVWDKRNEETDSVIGSGFELIWSRQRHRRDLLRFYWCGVFGDKEARDRVHPTQKPTKLLAEILHRWAPAACVVADPFAGSGSTLIAAHLTDRTACVMELDVRYVDTICARWQRATGVVPVLASSGKPVSFL